MKRVFLSPRTFAALACLFSGFVGFSSSIANADALVDPVLRPFAEGKTGQKVVKVLAVMENQSHGFAVPRRYDRENVLRYLQETSRVHALKMENYLRGVGALNVSVRPYQMFWINATIAAEVTSAGLKVLAQAPGVVKIYANLNVSMDPVIPGKLVPPPGRSRGDDQAAGYAFKDTGLDRLLAEDPRHTGAGVLIGSVDTGVDGKHPALAGKVAIFFDAKTKSRTEAFDRESHGTHTAGTMVGGDGTSVQIGVAPGARLVAAGALSGYDNMLAGMEFMLDPAGDHGGKDLPRAINNSWNCGGAPDVELFYRAIGAWEAAGILPVFSAGNAGPGTGTITKPHEHPATFAIGATAQDGKITSFSSRGPAVYHGQESQKPDITAPGNKIRSSLPGGRYGEMSGTSMATPHVTGATALIYQMNSALTPIQVRKILVASSLPVDEAGNPGKAGLWNKVYGFGRLNIYSAVKMAMDVAQKQMMGLRGGVHLASLSDTDWFSSPSDQDISGVLEETDEPFLNLVTYPEAATEEGHWLKSSELWK